MSLNAQHWQQIKETALLFTMPGEIAPYWRCGRSTWSWGGDETQVGGFE